MPDLIFADPRLAAIYDEIDGDRSDLDHYEAIVDEFDDDATRASNTRNQRILDRTNS